MNNYRHIYKQRKTQLFPLVFIFAVIIVIWQVLLPQWNDIRDTQNQVNDLRKAVETKRDNLRILNSIEDGSVKEAFNVAATALPVKKNILLIFNQLEQVSTRSNVGLGGFSLKVGGVYAKDPTKQEEGAKIDGIPFLNIVVTASGDTDSLRTFAEELYKSIPLTEINSVDLAETDGKFDVNFYYLPASLQGGSDFTSLVEPLSSVEMEQIESLRLWQ